MLLSKPVSTNSHPFLIQWLILGLGLLALGGAIGYSITHEYHRVDALERERLTTQARIVDANLERQLVALSLVLMSIRNDLPYWKTQKNNGALVNRYLQAMSDTIPGIRTIVITDGEGTVSASNRKQLIGLNFREREYVRAARQGLNPAMLYISPPFKSVLGVHVMNVTMVLLDTRGAFDGIISVALDPDFFSVLLNSVLYAPGMRASLVHGDGKIFVEVPNRKDLSGMDLAKPGSRYTLHVKSGRTANLFAAGKAYTTGDERMSAWRTIRPASLIMDKPLMISVNRDMRDIFATWHRGAFIQAGLFGVLALAAVFGLYFYLRRQRKFDRLATSYMTELQESEKNFRYLIEYSPLAIVVMTGADNTVRLINKQFTDIFGYTAEDIPDMAHWWQLAYPDEKYRAEIMAEWFVRVEQAVKTKGSIEPIRAKVICKDGSQRNIEFHMSSIGARTLVTFIDITERILAENELLILADIGRLIGSTLDIEEVYERFAVEARKLISFDRLTVNVNNHDQNTITIAYTFGSNVPGRRPGDSFPLQGSVNEALDHTGTGMLFHPTNIDELTGQYSRLVSTFQEGIRSFMSVPLISRNEVIGVLHFRSKKPNAYTDHDLRLAERIGAQIAGAIANAQLYAGLRKTEQDLKESELRYRELSIVDGLTQLYNSRHFYFQLKIELGRANRYEQPLTLLLFDLDDFKAFNDTYGHVEGDQVLWRLGQVLKRCLRETDFAFRYGGEEFTILLPMTTSADGSVIAERIRMEFKKETFSPVPAQEVHMTLSIGVAQYKSQEEMKTFVHRVDQLMYQGKKNGKDRVCSESSLYPPSFLRPRPKMP